MLELSKVISALVIASKEVSIEILIDFLKAKVAHLRLINSVSSAREVFHTDKPNVIFIDDSIPVDERLSLVKELCWEDPQVLIALISNNGNESQLVEMLKAGASDVICKPVDLVMLSDLLSRFESVIIRRHFRKFSPELFDNVHLDLKLACSTKAVSNAVMLLSHFISAVFNDRAAMRIELGLQEVLRNALEHGCLGIDYAQKKELCEQGLFDEYIDSKSNQARADGHSIRIEAQYLEDSLVVSVIDSGNGFDWKTMKSGISVDVTGEVFSGRGLLLINRIFDQVAYNDKGNQTILTIKF